MIETPKSGKRTFFSKPETLPLLCEIISQGKDKVLDREVRFNRGGFQAPDEIEGAFGHAGWGGSFAYAIPEYNLSVAYVTNTLLLDNDARKKILTDGINATISRIKESKKSRL